MGEVGTRFLPNVTFKSQRDKHCSGTQNSRKETFVALVKPTLLKLANPINDRQVLFFLNDIVESLNKIQGK